MQSKITGPAVLTWFLVLLYLLDGSVIKTLGVGLLSTGGSVFVVLRVRMKHDWAFFERQLKWLEPMFDWLGDFAADPKWSAEAKEEGGVVTLLAMKAKDISADPLRLIWPILQALGKGVFARLGFAGVELTDFIFSRLLEPLRDELRHYVATTEHGLWRSTGAVANFLGLVPAIVAFSTGHENAGAVCALLVALGMGLSGVGHWRTDDKLAAISRGLAAVGAVFIAGHLGQFTTSLTVITGLIFTPAGATGVFDYLRESWILRKVVGIIASVIVMAGGVVMLLFPFWIGALMISVGGLAAVSVTVGFHFAKLTDRSQDDKHVRN